MMMRQRSPNSNNNLKSGIPCSKDGDDKLQKAKTMGARKALTSNTTLGIILVLAMMGSYWLGARNARIAMEVKSGVRRATPGCYGS